MLIKTKFECFETLGFVDDIFENLKTSTIQTGHPKCVLFNKSYGYCTNNHIAIRMKIHDELPILEKEALAVHFNQEESERMTEQTYINTKLATEQYSLLHFQKKGKGNLGLNSLFNKQYKNLIMLPAKKIIEEIEKEYISAAKQSKTFLKFWVEDNELKILCSPIKKSVLEPIYLEFNNRDEKEKINNMEFCTMNTYLFMEAYRQLLQDKEYLWISYEDKSPVSISSIPSRQTANTVILISQDVAIK